MVIYLLYVKLSETEHINRLLDRRHLFPLNKAEKSQKTILSDLQGAWSVLRHSVADNAGFEGWDRMLFHIDEAMSWEVVRHLERMKSLLLIVRNIALRGELSEDIMQEIEDVSEILNETLKTHPQNKLS